MGDCSPLLAEEGWVWRRQRAPIPAGRRGRPIIVASIAVVAPIAVVAASVVAAAIVRRRGRRRSVSVGICVALEGHVAAATSREHQGCNNEDRQRQIHCLQAGSLLCAALAAEPIHVRPGPALFLPCPLVVRSISELRHAPVLSLIS